MISKIIAEDLINKAEKVINKSDKIAIVVHVAPDGDAIGSALGLYHYLRAIGKEVVVVAPTAFPAFLSWMPGAENILVHETQTELCEKKINTADSIFMLDFNVPSRMDKMADVVVNSPTVKVLVDHHLHPTDIAKVVISYPEISSTSELIFRLICRLGDFAEINISCAQCIYAGMMTDTGAFTYNSNKPEIYSIINELIKIGIDKDDIYRKVYNNYSADRMRLMGYALHSKMKIYPEHKAALIALTMEELEQFNYKIGDSEGLVNLPLSIEGVVFTAFMREDKDKIKISLRSQGTFPVNKVSADLFNGGGHLNAAGGESYSTLHETISKFEEALDSYKSFL